MEHFLAERYILYALSRRGLVSGRVHHSPYPIQRARLTRIDETLIAASDIARPDSEPLTHYASGVKVKVYPLRPLEPAPGLAPGSS